MGQCGKIRKAVEATDDNITYHMRNFCWVTKATDTHSEPLLFVAFQLQQWLDERS